jgi:hypothetical protein
MQLRGSSILVAHRIDRRSGRVPRSGWVTDLKLIGARRIRSILAIDRRLFSVRMVTDRRRDPSMVLPHELVVGRRLLIGPGREARLAIDAGRSDWNHSGLALVVRLKRFWPPELVVQPFVVVFAELVQPCEWTFCSEQAQTEEKRQDDKGETSDDAANDAGRMMVGVGHVRVVGY